MSIRELTKREKEQLPAILEELNFGKNESHDPEYFRIDEDNDHLLFQVVCYSDQFPDEEPTCFNNVHPITSPKQPDPPGDK